MPLEIEVGKRYRTRSGDVVEITERGYSETYPFLGTFITGRAGYVSSFTPAGQWVDGDFTEDDLIEELPADVDLLEGKPK